MKLLLSFLSIFLLLTFSVEAQTKGCHCAKDAWAGNVTQPDTIFHLSNGKNIALCGYKAYDKKTDTFNEFVLSDCDTKGNIGRWGAFPFLRIKVQQDTLAIQEWEWLRDGTDFSGKLNLWATEHLIFKNGGWKNTRVVQPKIHLYSQKQIRLVLKDYKRLVRLPDSLKETDPDGKILALMDKIFLAMLSGNAKAEQHFKHFPNDFVIDGEYGERYDQLKRLKKEYKTTNP